MNPLTTSETAKGSPNALLENETDYSQEYPVAMPVRSQNRRGSSLAKAALWLSQIGIGLGVGYWLANMQSKPDDRIELAPANAAHESTAITVTTAPIVSRKVERTIEAVGEAMPGLLDSEAQRLRLLQIVESALELFDHQRAEQERRIRGPHGSSAVTRDDQP